MILVLDFGGQYNQLIARRVREENVYCEVHTAGNMDKVRELKPEGIILTGGPQSVYEADSLLPPQEIFDLGVPILGICYGAQAMAKVLGGEVKSARVSEYGKTEVEIVGRGLWTRRSGGPRMPRPTTTNPVCMCLHDLRMRPS